VFTRAEALARLRISENTLGRLIASGRLPVVRLGRRVFIRASDVEALLTPEAVRS
jgi:excisionase family DNA binding protein